MTPADIFKIIIQHLLEALRLSMTMKGKAPSDSDDSEGIDEEFTPVVEAFLKSQGVEKQKSYGANIKLSGPAERNRK